MLKADTKEKLKLYGLDYDKLEAAIKDEKEVDFDVPEVEVFTADQLTKRDANSFEKGKGEGEKSSTEVLIKEVGKKLGFEPKGKRIGDLAKEIQEKIDATNDDKAKVLQDQVAALAKDKETLTSTLSEKEAAIKAISFKGELQTHFTPTSTSGLSVKDRLLLMENDIQFKEVDGKTVAYENGEMLTDPKTHSPLPIPDVVKSYEAKRKWDAPAQGAPTGGRGGQNSLPGAGTGGVKTYTQAAEQWKKDNPEGNPISPEFQSYIAGISKETPDFDFNN